ncbi:hypothetical protein, partial [Enterococcus faecium]
MKRPVVVRNTAQTRRGARALLAHPVLNETVVIGAVVVELSTASEADGPTASQQIEWALGWPEAMVWRERAAGRDQKD